MKYAIMILALVGVLASTRPATAMPTGNDLLRTCTPEDKAYVDSFCTADMVRWRDAFSTATLFRYQEALETGSNPKLGICIPKEVSIGQMEKVFLKYLRITPQSSILIHSF